MDTTEYLVDSEMMGAVEAYYVHGLYPGSYYACLLKGELDEALVRAHKLLRNEVTHDAQIRFIEECVPDYCKNENFDTWLGYYAEIDLSPELELFVVLRGDTLVEDWLAKYPADS